MDDIPIDIPYAKLGEWVEDRSSMIKRQHPDAYASLLVSAATLLRNVRYEIPALREEFNKATSGIREAEAIIADSARRKKDVSAQLASELSELGLTGCDEDDLFRCIEEGVPRWMAKCAEATKRSLEGPLAFYTTFTRWQCEGTRPPPCPVLTFFLSKGNRVVAELDGFEGVSELDACVPLLLSDGARAALVNDVLELQAFLATRHAEVATTSTHNALLTSDAPSKDTAVLAAYLDAVQSVLTALTGRATTHLLLLRASPQYRTRVLTSLRLQQQKISRFHAVGLQAEESIEVHHAALADTARLQVILTETKDLQAACERQLRKIYHPREVNIIGAINAL